MFTQNNVIYNNNNKQIVEEFGRSGLVKVQSEEIFGRSTCPKENIDFVFGNILKEFKLVKFVGFSGNHAWRFYQ